MPVPRDSFTLVTTNSGLRSHGLTQARIDAQLAADRWRRHGFAIVLHNGPLSREQRWHVARLHAGPRALLTGFAALESAGLKGWQRDVIDVLAPLGTRLRRGCPAPIRLHCRRAWADVRQSQHAPVQIAAQAVFVATSALEAPRPACGLLAATVQQRLLSPRRLITELEKQTRLHHRALLMSAAHDIAQGAQALSEIDFVRLCRRYHLPLPLQQLVRPEPSGRRRYLDATWRRRDGRLVAVEVDGALHLSQQRWWADQSRQNELALDDVLLLRYPSVVVRTEPATVAAQLRRALRTDG